MPFLTSRLRLVCALWTMSFAFQGLSLASPAQSSDVLQDLRATMAEKTIEYPGRTALLFVVDVHLSEAVESPNRGATLLFKNQEGGYTWVDDETHGESLVAAENEFLRESEPEELFVFHVNYETLFGSGDRLEQSLTNAWDGWTRMKDIEFEETLLYSLARDDRVFAEFKAPGSLRALVDTEWGPASYYAGLALEPDELAAEALRFPIELHSWIRDRLVASDWKPQTKRSLFAYAVITQDATAIRQLGAPVRAWAVEIARNRSAEVRPLGMWAIAALDPSGELLDEIFKSVADEHLIVAAIRLDESIAFSFQSERLRALALAARTSILEDLHKPIAIAKPAAEGLIQHGCSDLTLPDLARVLILTDRKQDLLAQGPEFGGALLEAIGDGQVDRRASAQLALEAYGDAFGATEVVSKRFREDPKARQVICWMGQAWGRPRFKALDSSAQSYLNLGDQIQALKRLVEEDPSFAGVLEEWRIAVEIGKPLEQWKLEGRLDWKVFGAGLKEVSVDFHVFADHPLRVVEAPGLWFRGRSNTYQNMVSVVPFDVVLTPGEENVEKLMVACANWERKIPTFNTPFDIERVAPTSAIGRLLAQDPGVEMTPPLAQYAVWMLTNDLNRRELLAVRWGGGRTHTPGSDKEIAQALRWLDSAGIPSEHRRVWQDRSRIVRELDAGELLDWMKQRIDLTPR